MLEHRIGDVLATTDIDALAHGCNCQGPMGGFAGLVRKAYGEEFYQDYLNRCQEASGVHSFKPGDAYCWYKTPGRVPLFNLATQFYPGASARYDWLGQSVREMCRMALVVPAWLESIPQMRVFGLPRIGSGIGGLEWEVTEKILENILLDFPEITLAVYTME